MAYLRGVSPLAMALTLGGVVAVFLVGGWVAGTVVAGLYANPAATTAAPIVTPSRLTTTAAGAQATTGAPSPDAARTFVVVVDAGHQGRADNHQEPIGPGSTQTKPAVASGTEGVVTHNPENVINLDVSLMLRDLLASQPGVRVVMIRTTPDVDIPNSQRAKIAAREHADLLIRVHCDGVDKSSVHGLLTMVPSKNRWTVPIFAASARAGRFVQDATLAATGAQDRGILEVGNMAGFNWSTVPSVIVEMGVMTNPTDDRLLADPVYQRKLASGMSRGVMDYLHSLP